MFRFLLPTATASTPIFTETKTAIEPSYWRMADSSRWRVGISKREFLQKRASVSWHSISADTAKPSLEPRPPMKKVTRTFLPQFDTCTQPALDPFPLWAQAWAEMRLQIG